MAYGNFDTPGVGVIGSAGGDPGDGIGVLGLSQGVEPGGIGVKAFSTSYVGLWAEINGAEIPGDAYPENNPGPIAVWAVCNNSRGTGVLARSLSGDGVVAHGATGVRAVGYQQNAVVGESGAGDHGGRNGVSGFCGHVGHSGVWGHHTQAGGTGVGGTCSGANQRWGKVESALWIRRRSHSPTAPRCLRMARYGRAVGDLRKTDRVSGWHPESASR